MERRQSHAANWRRYRRTRAVAFGGVALTMLYVAAYDYWPGRLWVEANVSEVVLLILPVLLVIWVVALLDLINWKCPRCGDFFSYPARDAPRCQHCGLLKFAVTDEVMPT